MSIPIGPVNLEVFHTALKKHYPQALSVAIGGALGDAIWAIVAFFGVTPFQKPNTEGIFFVATAVITFILGYFALKDAHFIEKTEEAVVAKIRRKRWALLKGLSMVLLNPLGIISWMIALKFLKQLNIYIPMELKYEIVFFFVVMSGATTYFSLIVFITNRMKNIFNPSRTVKISRFLGYLLMFLSLYFLFHGVKAFCFQ